MTKKDSGKKRVGRPTSYKPEYAELGRKACLLGATNDDLAGFFDVATSTVSKWIAEIPEFSESIKAGRQQADADVANRLYCRAMGYEHDSEEIKVIGQDVVRVPVRKQYPPDTTAAIFWLKNRQRDRWRDKSEVESTVKVDLATALRMAERIIEP